MITIDQAKIDAPDFPRSQEWWSRFLPDTWMRATVRSDGTVQVEPVRCELPPDRGPQRAAAAKRNRERELAVLGWLSKLPRLEVAIVEDAGERCQCWRQPARLHDGHCCFTDARVCHANPEHLPARTEAKS